jgi:hypothetical protein
MTRLFHNDYGDYKLGVSQGKREAYHDTIIYLEDALKRYLKDPLQPRTIEDVIQNAIRRTEKRLKD